MQQGVGRRLVGRRLVGRRAFVLTLALVAAGCGDGGADGSAEGGNRGGEGAPAEAPAPSDSTAAGGSADAAAEAERMDSVTLVFSRDEEPHPVRRAVPADSGGLSGPRSDGSHGDVAVDLGIALELLLRGPTPEERADGIDSWFSEETAGALDTVTVDSGGDAVVDFQDLPALIPNASSSAGSRMLLQQLDGTVFGVPEVRSVEYRVGGSCARFWEWLQYECRVVERPERLRPPSAPPSG